MKYISKVREFHTAFCPREAPAQPGLPGSLTPQSRTVRLQLITEEFSELVMAHAGGDLVGCMDALTDLEYVVCGTLVACGADRSGHAAMIPSYEQGGSGPPRLPHADLFLQLSSDFLMQVGALAGALAGGNWQAIAGQTLLVRQRLAQLWAAFWVSEELREALFTEVHRSNMTKLGADGKPVVNASGRVVKGPAFEEPKLELVMLTIHPPAEARETAQ